MAHYATLLHCGEAWPHTSYVCPRKHDHQLSCILGKCYEWSYFYFLDVFCLIGPNLLTCNEWNIKVNTFMTTITLWGLTSKIGLSLHLFWLSLHLVQLMLGPQFYIFIAVPHCKQHIALALSHNVMIHHTTAVQLMLCAWLWLLLQHPDDSNT